MIGSLPLVFSAPWVLIALVGLPALWWLLRVTPPRPNAVIFPPLRLLLDIRRPDETPARMPWWLVALRMLIALLIVLAVAGPALRPVTVELRGTGPLWLIVDNGFSAAPDWAARKTSLLSLVDQAARADRTLVVAATADGPQKDMTAVSPEQARRQIEALSPRAWFPDRRALIEPLTAAARSNPPGELIYLAEGVDTGTAGDWFANLERLTGGIPTTVIASRASTPAAIETVQQDSTGAEARLVRADANGIASGVVRLVDRKGHVLDEQPFAFAPSNLRTATRFNIPLEIKNDVARAEIVGAGTAAGVQLLDEGWRRRLVGILTGSTADQAQPLIAPDYFLSRALAPFADVRPSTSPALADAIKLHVDNGIAALILADVGRLNDQESKAATDFMNDGGVLIRFAGPRLAAADDPLVPVPLRKGDRVLGGALSWEKPQHLGAFPEDGPFFDLKAADDVTVDRQLLAEPSLDLNEHTWAQLADGTPLVTARRVGAGWLVLFHVTADTRWSNLAISGTFVEMLRRTVALGHGKSAPPGGGQHRGEVLLPPLSVLDGYGRLGPAPVSVHGLASGEAAKARASRETPPGLYGSDDGFTAVNLITADTAYRPLDLGPTGATVHHGELTGSDDIAFGPWLLAAAFIALLLDGALILWLTGRLRPSRAASAGLLIVLAAAAIAPVNQAHAEDKTSDQALVEALSTTRLAYVRTGDPAVDEESRAGLWGLGQYLSSRTSLEPGDPIAVDPASDELALFPLIYWPVTTSAPLPSAQTMGRIEAFMKSGGTVLFDTRDQMDALPGRNGGQSPEQTRLAEMLSTMDIPPLEPVPANHVLGKSFFLLTDFPGRYEGSPLWIEADQGDSAEVDAGRPVRAGDGVSPILITGNDLAGAWAADDNGSFLYPLVPGTPTQRDHAFRTGVNIVMYVLTGNYKADQVHIPALLERLGQ